VDGCVLHRFPEDLNNILSVHGSVLFMVLTALGFMSSPSPFNWVTFLSVSHANEIVLIGVCSFLVFASGFGVLWADQGQTIKS
jgi:hypothetical protein